MAAVDSFATQSQGLDSAPRRAADIVPSDTADLSFVTRAIHIGGAGDVKVTTVDGDTVTLKGFSAGQTKVGRYARVWATGTTATSLVAEW